MGRSLTTLERDVAGVQLPRVSSAPRSASSQPGDDAVELASFAGLELDPWQQHVLRVGLGERPDRKWSAFEVGLVVPRQNGKGAVLEARELAGLFLFGERLIIHSAHEMKTAVEAFIRIKSLIQETPQLDAEVAAFYQSNERTAIELRDGRRLRFMARSGGSGRGFSGDCVILDEAYALSAEMMAAMLPTMSARPNPQLWYASSAGMESSQVLSRVRERGVAGDKRLAYFEWSAPPESELDDREMWAVANPGLGIRIDSEFVEAERAAMTDPEFARERLGVWADAFRGGVIPSDVWSALLDRESSFDGRPALAADVSLDRGWASIAAAGRRGDGRVHVEVIQNEKGTSWVAGRLAEVAKKAGPCAVVVDPSGPAGSLLPELKEMGVEVTTTGAREFGQACGGFYDDAVNDKLRHLGFTKLNVAVDSARKRSLGTAWAWDFRGSGVDGTPLTSVTLARHGLAMFGAERPKSKAIYGF